MDEGLICAMWWTCPSMIKMTWKYQPISWINKKWTWPLKHRILQLERESTSMFQMEGA